MTVFGVAGLTAPVIGPTLGGWITVNYSWRWIFLINLPIGVLGYLMCHFAVRDPEYLERGGRSCVASRSTSTTSAWGCSPW